MSHATSVVGVCVRGIYSRHERSFTQIEDTLRKRVDV